MCVCKKCGFTSYPSLWKSDEEIKAYYRKDYRQPPTIGNLYTGQRKLHFHQAFLDDVFKEWKAKGKTKPVVCEIGAAYGLALEWLRKTYPCEVHGTELTVSYRRNALHEFGIKLTEDFDDSRKYDLIISYKVAEHQTDVDKHLRKYVESLTDDGLMYISVPTWFDSLANFGQTGFDLKYYYDTNHINVWTVKLFETLLKKVGLEIIKKDHKIYDSTYLCKRNDALMSEPLEYENPTEIKAKMKAIKEAFMAFNDNRLDDAIKLWPDYPMAHLNKAEQVRVKLTENGWEWFKENIIDVMFKCCPNSPEAYALACDFAMRAKKFPEALKYAEDCLKVKPHNPVCYLQIINIMRELAIHAPDDHEKIHYFTQGRNVAKFLASISQQHFADAMTYIYYFNAQIPEEVANAS